MLLNMDNACQNFEVQVETFYCAEGDNHYVKRFLYHVFLDSSQLGVRLLGTVNLFVTEKS